jgi:amino acid adenylation domain-containing protein
MTEVTRLPRWSAAPAAGTAETTVAVPATVARLAAALSVPEAAVLLAAYLRVVGAVSGESDITVGYAVDGAPARPLSIDLADRTWRELIATAAPWHEPIATAAPWHELIATAAPGGDGPRDFDTTFGRDDNAALSVRIAGGTITIRYDTAAFDAEHIDRFAGYLTAAVAAMDADPDVPANGVDLLSPAERHAQLVERNGAQRGLPDQRFHQIFADRAKAHPDTVAAICRDEIATYEHLNRAANRVAHALLANGLRREGVVTIATERGLPWMAAIIGTFKAGGVYLPVEPDWPAARVASLLEQSGSHLLLTEPGGHPGAGERPDVTALVPAEIVADDGHPAHNPDVQVDPGDAAYIYFTSGSTGLPKGATCEHLGMLNHLYAKIDDLRITADDVVVQSTQSSFDISLWQLIAALLVGGRTVIVPRKDALDVPRFLDFLVAQDASVAQVVPSFLDVILDHVTQHPRDLGRLREVSVTGEAITRPLIARWFAAFPGIRLINAYGATEVSDDTTHEIMSEPPPDDTVPVGRALNNVAVSVLGPGDTLVPFGAPGEIVFSGICVGRGYINDAVRTAEAFGEDPQRPGMRMYRTGDFGRWLPDGKLGFHGRRDEQVKIHGIRIELGEVESRLLAHPRIRSGSVVAVPVPHLGKELVAFYTAGEDLPADALRDHLTAVLPNGYVPKRLYQVAALPLTANGKVDKRTLIARAMDEMPEEVASDDVPVTEAERRIATTWATVLDVPVDRIGRGDRFFSLGGSSLAALRMVAALGGLVSIEDVIRDPELKTLAAGVAAPA